MRWTQKSFPCRLPAKNSGAGLLGRGTNSENSHTRMASGLPNIWLVKEIARLPGKRDRYPELQAGTMYSRKSRLLTRGTRGTHALPRVKKSSALQNQVVAFPTSNTPAGSPFSTSMCPVPFQAPANSRSTALIGAVVQQESHHTMPFDARPIRRGPSRLFASPRFLLHHKIIKPSPQPFAFHNRVSPLTSRERHGPLMRLRSHPRNRRHY
jgi:hypothetical protein